MGGDFHSLVVSFLKERDREEVLCEEARPVLHPKPRTLPLHPLGECRRARVQQQARTPPCS